MLCEWRVYNLGGIVYGILKAKCNKGVGKATKG